MALIPPNYIANRPLKMPPRLFPGKVLVPLSLSYQPCIRLSPGGQPNRIEAEWQSPPRKACDGLVFLLFVEGGDAGEGFAFQEFEGGSAAGAAVGDFVGDAEFFGGGGGVASTDDGDGSGRGGLGEALGLLAEELLAEPIAEQADRVADTFGLGGHAEILRVGGVKGVVERSYQRTRNLRFLARW